MSTPKVYCICDNNCKRETLTREQILTAIAQAVETGEIHDVDAGFITTIKTVDGKPLYFFRGTAAEYEAVCETLTVEQKEGLFAVITNDGTAEYLENLEKMIEDIIIGNREVAQADNARTADSALWAEEAKTVNGVELTRNAYGSLLIGDDIRIPQRQLLSLGSTGICILESGDSTGEITTTVKKEDIAGRKVELFIQLLFTQSSDYTNVTEDYYDYITLLYKDGKEILTAETTGGGSVTIAFKSDASEYLTFTCRASGIPSYGSESVSIVKAIKIIE